MLPVWLSLLLAVSAGPTFRDAAASAGITFVHEMGKSGQRMMVETMGSGGGFLDFDNDGDLDLYLVNGAPMPGWSGTGRPANALYRNDGGVRFTDVTAQSGTGDTGYGMGICAGDVNNDGFVDLYVANFGPNVLYLNAGDGTFTDATARAGVGDASWSSSCAFLDYDRDGDLDLFVVNYVDFTPENDKFCGDYAKNVKAYCHPSVYESQPDVLYRNEGDGTFTDASEPARLTARRGNGLGVVAGDYDGDGWVDLYVANDKTPNVLYHNARNGTFEDVTLTAGVGYSLDGLPQAGMGTDFGDYDGDGDLDIIVTNLDFEYNALYRNEGGGVFSDVAFAAGVGAISLSYVGFGAEFLDYDNDGRIDLAIANGHILDNAPYFNDATTYAQRPFLFRGRPEGGFDEVGRAAGDAMFEPIVGRGLAAGDVDGDGDLDMLVTVCGGRPRLLINEGGSANAWLGIRLVGTGSNRSAIGARVTARGPGGMLTEEVRSGGSYQSQSDLRIHLGLGPSPKAPPELHVRWPSGATRTLVPPGLNRYVTIVEGQEEIVP